VAAASLAEFKARLDGALSTLGWGKVSLPTAGGLEPDDLYGPFQPKTFCDSMKLCIAVTEVFTEALFLQV